MSYDIDIAGEWFNCTWNVGGLFYDHIPAQRSERGGLAELDGLTGKQACEVLHRAFEKIDRAHIDQRGFANKYDAENGWGTTYGATVFLARVLAACALHPRHKVRFST